MRIGATTEGIRELQALEGKRELRLAVPAALVYAHQMSQLVGVWRTKNDASVSNCSADQNAVARYQGEIDSEKGAAGEEALLVVCHSPLAQAL